MLNPQIIINNKTANGNLEDPPGYKAMVIAIINNRIDDSIKIWSFIGGIDDGDDIITKLSQIIFITFINKNSGVPGIIIDLKILDPS